MVKIVIIGAGSYAWGPTFLRDIFITPALKGSTVTLHDIDSERLNLNFSLGQKMILDFKLDFILEQTLSLDEALEDADFIILTITTGGLEAMRPDLEIPWKYGIRQSVGDTVGPGGISRLLRNIPVVSEIARRVDILCPNAWFLNYTNPLTVLTGAIDKQRSVRNRTVGLCHEWIGVREKLASHFGVSPEKLDGKIAGINHFIWLTDLSAEGESLWNKMSGLADQILCDQVDLDPGDTSVFVDKCKVKARLFQIYGAFPAAGDRHVAEFMPSIICAETNWGADFGFKLTSVDDRQAMMFFERALIESALRGETPLEPFMQELSGETASQIISAITSRGTYRGIMNLPNIGQIEDLPVGSILETYGSIDQNGAQPIFFGRLPPGIQSLVERHIRGQEITFNAAMTGDRSLVLQAMLNDPFTSHLTVDQMERMLDELLIANKVFLPQFS